MEWDAMPKPPFTEESRERIFQCDCWLSFVITEQNWVNIASNFSRHMDQNGFLKNKIRNGIKNVSVSSRTKCESSISIVWSIQSCIIIGMEKFSTEMNDGLCMPSISSWPFWCTNIADKDNKIWVKSETVWMQAAFHWKRYRVHHWLRLLF